MFLMHIHTVIYHSVVYAKCHDRTGLAAQKKEKIRKRKQLCFCPGDSKEAEAHPGE